MAQPEIEEKYVLPMMGTIFLCTAYVHNCALFLFGISLLTITAVLIFAPNIFTSDVSMLSTRSAESVY
jgi:hypothetical protein